MSLVSLLFGGNRDLGFKESGASAFALQLDLMLSESHEYSSAMTDYPVEEGGSIADHIVNDPEQLEIEGFITNSPIKFFPSLFNVGDRVQTALDTLMSLRDSKTPFTVVSALKVYEDMFFSDISISRDRRTGQSLRFTASLQKIKKVSTEITSLAAQAYIDIAMPMQDVGFQSTPPM